MVVNFSTRFVIISQHAVLEKLLENEALFPERIS
jgi:hypothetical protein